MTLSMTEAGVDFLSRQEGFRSRSYLDRAGKPTSKGLSTRRERERRLFLFADYGDGVP